MTENEDLGLLLLMLETKNNPTVSEDEIFNILEEE